MTRLPLLTSIAALCVATPAAAQIPADSTPVQLEGVTVTVLRTPMPVIRAPYALSVVDAARSAPGRPGLALDEALRAVPGVQIDNRYNYALGERISIRGFGARAQFGVRGIRVLVDGVPATFPDGQTSLSHLELGALSRVEVVRGPASALYGGSSGGVLQLETLPPADVGEGTVTAGSNGLLRVGAAVGGADSWLVRASHQSYDGPRDHSNAAISRLQASLRRETRLGMLGVNAFAVDYDADNPGSLSQLLLEEDRTQAFANNVNQRTGERGRQAQVGATLTRGGLELAGWGIVREVENPIPASIIDLERRVAGFRAVQHLAEDWFSGAFGVEAATQRDQRLNFENLAGDRGSVTLDQDETVNNTALFGQLAIRPLERLTLVQGLRYDHHRFAADDALVTEGNPDDSGRITMSRFSPSFGASLRVVPGLNVYLNAATAFETPSTTELANRPDAAGGFNPDLRPQETESLEAGFKGLSGPVAFDLAVYTADVTNALIPFEVEGAPDRQFFRNAGSARHRGVEASVGVDRGGLQARLAYTFTDARFVDYVVDGTAFDGGRVPGIAPHRVEGLLDLSRGRLFGALEGRTSSRTPVNDANSASSPGYLVIDARIGLRDLEVGGISTRPVLGISNLFDERYNGSVVVNAFGQRYYEPAPGRALHLGLRVGF